MISLTGDTQQIIMNTVVKSCISPIRVSLGEIVCDLVGNLELLCCFYLWCHGDDDSDDNVIIIISCKLSKFTFR